MASATWPLLALLVLVLLAWLASTRQAHLLPPHATGGAPRRLKPRPPDDCPTCRQQQACAVPARPAPLTVRPWREVRSPRGAPKRVATHGYACPCPTCPYAGITDAQVHALVGDGRHGQVERIQTFRCQACRTTFSARRDTPLYRLKTPASRVSEVLAALAEGLDISATARIFGHRPATITTWLVRAGAHGAALHARRFRRLYLPHLQLDELRTRLRCRAHVQWLWVAIDPLTKIVPAIHLGPRTQGSAHALVHILRQTLAPGCVPVFTSDGLRLYYYALTAHFGHWVAGTRRCARGWLVASDLLYGQVRKVYRHRRLARVTPVLRCGAPEAFRQALTRLGLSGRLNTAFVERVNLTLRHGVAALARRTWATAQQAPRLVAHVEWWRVYYHFARPHASLRVALVRPLARGGRRCAQRYHARTPAMAAGLASRRWTVRDILTVPLPTERVGLG